MKHWILTERLGYLLDAQLAPLSVDPRCLSWWKLNSMNPKEMRRRLDISLSDGEFYQPLCFTSYRFRERGQGHIHHNFTYQLTVRLVWCLISVTMTVADYWEASDRRKPNFKGCIFPDYMFHRRTFQLQCDTRIYPYRVPLQFEFGQDGLLLQVLRLDSRRNGSCGLPSR